LYSNLCGKDVAKHPYGELGSVGRGNCFCCVSADSAFGPISPGCGCDSEKVDDIVTVLKERVRARGDTAQIKRAEETLERLQEVDAKLVRSLAHPAKHQTTQKQFKVKICLGLNCTFLIISSYKFFSSPQNLIMNHLNIPQPERMGEREAVVG
jgi:hypothetical protein